MRVPLSVIDWRACSFLLLRYHTGKRRIEWEVWRWISTPGTDESMAALSQTRAAMLWSVKQKYDPSKSLRLPFTLFLIALSLICLLSPITIGIYMCCNRVLPPIQQHNFDQGKLDWPLVVCWMHLWNEHIKMSKAKKGLKLPRAEGFLPQTYSV